MKKLIMLLATVITISIPISTLASSPDTSNGATLLGIGENYEYTVTTYYETKLSSESIYNNEFYENYIVEKGDTLYAISKEYNVTVDQLMLWNNLTSDLILIGQELIVQEQEDDYSVVTTNKVVSTEEDANNEPKGKTLIVTATAYTAECKGCTGITFTGIDLNKDRHAKVIAVDPKVIPLGTKVYVEGYGYAVAGDIGGAIKGHRIDVHLPTKKEAYAWGVKEVKVTIVE